MSKFLYFLVYNFDLGPLGPRVLDLALRTWLSKAHTLEASRNERRTTWLQAFMPQPSFEQRR